MTARLGVAACAIAAFVVAFGTPSSLVVLGLGGVIAICLKPRLKRNPI